MPLTFASADAPSIPLHLLDADTFPSWSETLAEGQRAWLGANGFTGAAGQLCLLPGAGGIAQAAVAGMTRGKARDRKRFELATIAAKLPEGTYHLETDLAGDALEEQALGWLLGSYRFDRYKKAAPMKARLKAPEGVDAARLEAIAAGESLTRDLINTPASDMGPEALESAFKELTAQFDASMNVVRGDALLEQNYPMIHTVGRASTQAPRLLEMRWGARGPKLTLVGKGVCFDTGGLNLKPGASMGLMKKDMGGAATVMGLAHMIMALDLPLQLRVLIPAVENAVAGNAFRPQDVLTSRKGLTVEINNTDAEGRLVLADALALADEESVDCIVSMATLTGAARVALGPDIAPFYATDPNDAAALSAAGAKVADPVWQMPFHDPYEGMIEPAIADLDNAPAGGFAGSITAALFLKRFVEHNPKYLHFDIYGWQPSPSPARPKGGVGQGARALLEALPKVLNL
ncbi:leucyl aminopeptidase [Actibacterium atlanticum]|uniref:Leucyl aminopeptidase n=1 Tax=Actibacterium atlanticum TaxID=1461693 RepID=A0A058ZL50_9RHOB|nr:leucyl aminopeptidase family protein [Actibacterium atlanticum]KCV82253.1 leucyl aminopeptidase [Actibacterium atlanticum]